MTKTQTKSEELNCFVSMLNTACNIMRIASHKSNDKFILEKYYTARFGLKVFLALDDLDTQIRAKRSVEKGWGKVVAAVGKKAMQIDDDLVFVAKSMFVLNEFAEVWVEMTAEKAIKEAQGQ